jgi:hypothetical protein
MTLGTVPHSYVTSHRGHCPLLIRWERDCGRGRGTKKKKPSAVVIMLQVWSIPTLMPLESKRRQNTINNTDWNVSCNTCDMYMSDLRHIHDPVLLSLKMEGIRLLFHCKQQLYMSYGFADSMRAGSCSQAVSKPLLCVQWKTPDDGQKNCPKHLEFHSKNKFEKLVYLFGIIIRNLS